MIKDNFLLRFSLKEVLFMAVVGAAFSYTIQLYDEGLTYQWMVSAITFIGTLLFEVPTTQQKFLDILVKAVRYIFIQELYFQDTRSKEEERTKE